MSSGRNIIETGELGLVDFNEPFYINEQNREMPMYEFTEDGGYIVMPFIGGAWCHPLGL
jgi:phage regulator Rha-like protein